MGKGMAAGWRQVAVGRGKAWRKEMSVLCCQCDLQDSDGRFSSRTCWLGLGREGERGWTERCQPLAAAEGPKKEGALSLAEKKGPGLHSLAGCIYSQGLSLLICKEGSA